MLVGRDGERDHVERLLEQASSGRSAALVVRGEAGMGKSALLGHAVAAAGGMRVLRGVGIESEAELAFGALHLLLYPYLDRLELLPGPQAAALRGAFGLSSDTAATPFLVGAATLTLLAELAAEQPLLCVVDDAQWLDRGSSDALLFAVRDTAVPFRTPGIEELRLPGLSPEAAARLLDERSPGLTAPMRARVLEEAGGNPLALLELGAARLPRNGKAARSPRIRSGRCPSRDGCRTRSASRSSGCPRRASRSCWSPRPIAPPGWRRCCASPVRSVRGPPTWTRPNARGSSAWRTAS